MAIPIWVHVVILIASAALSYAMRPRMQGPQPAAFEDIQFPQFEEGTPQSVVFGDVWCNDWMVLGVGNYRTSEVRKKVGSGVFRKRQTIGHRYYFDIHMGVARAFDELVEIRVGDRVAWSGSATSGIIEINEPNLFGGDEEEGGIDGTLHILTGAADQPVHPGLAAMLGGFVPAFRGTATLFYSGQVSAMSPYPKPWAMRMRRALSGWEGATWNPGRAVIALAGGTIHAANTAHMIYECITNRAWGRGLSATWIDAPSFEAAAQTLVDEGFGLCLRWARQDGLDQFIQALLDHVGGVLRTDRVTGLLTLKLIRDDHDPGDLPVFTFDTGLLGVDDDETAAQGAETNEVIVVYRRPQDGSEGRVRVNNLASIQASGGAKSTRTIQYPGIPTPELALRVAQRDLLIYSGALRRFKVRLDRRGRWIQTGDAFRISVPSRGIQNMVLRAGRVDTGTPTSGVITIDAIEDQFGLPQSSWIEHQASEWTPPNRIPMPVDHALAIELPYTMLADMLPTAELAALPETAGLLGIAASRPSEMSLDYMITTRVGESGAFVERNEGGFSSTGLLSASMPMTQAPVVVTLDEPVDLQGVVIGDAALIEEEILRVDAINIATSEITLARGCADTVPAAHDAGARVWFLGAVGVDEETRYDDEDAVQAKLLTRTSAGTLDSSAAPIESVTMQRRQDRPFPPGRLLINGGAYPDSIDGTADLTISWAHRDRVSQGADLIDTAHAPIGPEPDTTYAVHVYGEADELLAGHIDLPGPPFVLASEGFGPPWTPAEIETEAWFDAADMSTITIDTGVSAWADKSGNDRHVVQANGSLQPTLGEQDGRPVLVFGGGPTGHALFNAAPGGLFRSVAHGHAFVVRKHTEQPTTRQSVLGVAWHPTTANSRILLGGFNGKSYAGGRRLNSDGYQEILAATDAGTGWGIVEARYAWADAALSIYLDAVLDGVNSSFQTAGSTSDTNAVFFSVGGLSPGNVERLAGEIAEVLLVHGALSGADVARIEGYLAHKWGLADGLPGGHAYKDGPPLVGSDVAGRYRIELAAVRDDLVSRQKHDIKVRRHGLGFSLGLFLGGV